MRPHALLRSALLALLVPTLALAQGLRFTTLDIGQGDAAVLIAPSGCVALFDAGPTGSGATIKAYLRALGVTRVDMAFISHLHADHMGGMDEVEQGTDGIPVTAVYDHGGTYSSTAYTQYDTQYAGRRVKVTAGQSFSLCNEVTLQVVAANANGRSTSDENARSVTVKVTYGAFDALVGGDLPGVSPDDLESLIGQDVGELELYKVHHHGSRYSSNETFLAATRPLVSFISVGMNNTYGHPTAECLSRLAAVGSDVWQTEDPAAGVKRGHIELASSTGGTFTVSQGGSSVQYSSKGPATPDTQAPGAPGSLVASATSSSDVDLTWSASTDNVGVTGYRVYRSADGASFARVGTSTTTGFADMGLTASTPYWYRVTALDAAGNESAASNTASATTLGPQAFTLTAPNGGESWPGGTTQSITWTSTSVASVRLEYSADNGASWSLIASGVDAASGSYAWTVPNSSTTGARVRVSDAADGSPSDVSDGAFSVTASGPAVVILNELLANEPGSDTSGEFIEVVNVGGTDITIAGWTLSDASGVRHTFASGTVLKAGQALVVFGDASAIPAGMGNAVPSSTGSLSLNNSGDTVTLKNGKKAVDSVSYSSSLAGTDGVSMNRNPDATAGAGFTLHTSLSLLSASPGTRASGASF